MFNMLLRSLNPAAHPMRMRYLSKWLTYFSLFLKLLSIPSGVFLLPPTCSSDQVEESD